MTLTAALVRERVRGTILERIGETPLVPLRRIGAGLRGELWAKIESANPGGSVKDRPALAMVCAVRGHRARLVMPDKVSLERKQIIRAFGAEVVLTDPLDGTDGAIR